MGHDISQTVGVGHVLGTEEFFLHNRVFFFFNDLSSSVGKGLVMGDAPSKESYQNISEINHDSQARGPNP
jgi:hypothetical protein